MRAVIMTAVLESSGDYSLWGIFVYSLQVGPSGFGSLKGLLYICGNEANYFIISDAPHVCNVRCRIVYNAKLYPN